MRLIRTLAILLLASICPARAATIDFSTTTAMQATCADARQRKPAQLRRDNDKVAYVICSGIDLVMDTARWVKSNSAASERIEDASVRQGIRAKAEEILGKLKIARQLLDSVHTGKPLFTIEPGAWQLDLDGDGTITPFEKHFFWVAKRGNDRIAAFSGLDAPEEYYAANFIRPVIKLDQSDVYWAAAYLNFAEAALNLVLAYDYQPGSQEGITLRDAGRIRSVAYPRLLAGIQASKNLRASLLEETGDDHEWIANPRQVNSAFPLVLDAQSFATWGALLDHIDKLLRGKTLLGGTTPASGPGEARRWRATDLAFGLCKPGEGLNLRDLFLRPLPHPGNMPELAARCVRPTAAMPFTSLDKLIEDSLKRNATRSADSAVGEWMLLRHLYWVN